MQPSRCHDPEHGGGIAQREHLGVGGRIVQVLTLVVARAPDTRSPQHDHGSDRDVAVDERGGGLA